MAATIKGVQLHTVHISYNAKCESHLYTEAIKHNLTLNTRKPIKSNLRVYFELFVELRRYCADTFLNKVNFF